MPSNVNAVDELDLPDLDSPAEPPGSPGSPGSPESPAPDRARRRDSKSEQTRRAIAEAAPRLFRAEVIEARIRVPAGLRSRLPELLWLYSMGSCSTGCTTPRQGARRPTGLST